MKVCFCASPDESGSLPYFIMLLLKKKYPEVEWIQDHESAEMLVFFHMGAREEAMMNQARRQGRHVLAVSGETEKHSHVLNYHRYLWRHRIPSITMNQSLVQSSPKRHVLVPLWVQYYHVYQKYVPQIFSLRKQAAKRDRFCCFLARDPKRFWLERLVSLYQEVDCRDQFLIDLKNLDLQTWKVQIERQGLDYERVKYTIEKALWLSRYRFSIGRENRLSAFYNTEKLLDALISGTVCFYFGSPEILQDFNPKAFIYVRSRRSAPRALWRLRRLDLDPARCQAMLDEAVLNPGVIEDKYSLERICRQLHPSLP